MLTDIVHYIKGTYVIEAHGRFPERILNIAAARFIYVRDVKKDGENLTFSVSKRGWECLCRDVPDALELSVKQKYGFPFFFRRYKKRLALFFLPLLFAALSFVYSSFIWRVEISGATPSLQKKVLSTLSDMGVRRGAYIRRINPDEIKRRVLLKHSDLTWMWLNLDGTSAEIEIVPRKKAPSTIKITEPANVIAQRSGLVTKIQTFCGTPLVTVGEAVEKGQILISGIFKSENENIPVYYHHAGGIVEATVWDEKAVILPKQLSEKVRTGNKKSAFGVNFTKNNVNFSINSRISYREYDKIVKNIRIPFLGVAFFRADYYEVNVNMRQNDLTALIDKEVSKMRRAAEKSGASNIKISTDTADCGASVILKMRMESTMRIDKEIPIDKGDTNGKTD